MHGMLSFISNLGPLEIILILIAAVLIFGRNLPEVAARGAIQVQKLRKGVRDFRRESGFDEEVRRARELIEDPVRQALKELDAKEGEFKRPFVGQHPEAEVVVEADEDGRPRVLEADEGTEPKVVELEAAGRTVPEAGQALDARSGDDSDLDSSQASDGSAPPSERTDDAQPRPR